MIHSRAASTVLVVAGLLLSTFFRTRALPYDSFFHFVELGYDLYLVKIQKMLCFDKFGHAFYLIETKKMSAHRLDVNWIEEAPRQMIHSRAASAVLVVAGLLLFIIFGICE